eukprot:TRINITY_DN3508_c0_g4_i1.p1 TRINITY_DN3508_c0_g4~~TRINITY_DN3508_c0_g4_i1.p1  ORF type:complete len:195 (-),score=58.52 TRINITY_DN3508_c0_g4_i1:49-633(-)
MCIRDRYNDRAEWKEIMMRVKEGKASSKDLFRLIDMTGNSNGFVDKGEFTVMCRRLGNELSQHRVNEIFTEVKKHSNSKDTEMNVEEFDQALMYLSKKNVLMSLEYLGINLSTLIVMLVTLIALLLLLFTFIFVGINAFSVGGAFGAAVNSSIPAGAGLGLSQASGKKASDQLNDEAVNETVQSTNKILTSKYI